MLDLSTQDENIIGTSTYDIVCKRNVEKFYNKRETQVLRPFVQKFKRRAPAINRGFWLRMRAIDSVVGRFLLDKAGKSKAIINLGCGFDCLPWRLHTQYPEESKDIQFLDLDHPQLIERKNAILSSESCNEEVPDLRYAARGCDLRDLSTLRAIIETEFALQSHAILFVAEVSIAYMAPDAADALIKMVCGYKHARFCLLDQCLPDGPSHPFALTMLEHFRKRGVPLDAIEKYTTTQDQEQRFLLAGWRSVSVCNLWDLWQSKSFLTASERRRVDAVEPCDDIDKFVQFASHHFVLVADTTKDKIDTFPPPAQSSASSPTVSDMEMVDSAVLLPPVGRGQHQLGALSEATRDAVVFDNGVVSDGLLPRQEALPCGNHPKQVGRSWKELMQRSDMGLVDFREPAGPHALTASISEERPLNSLHSIPRIRVVEAADFSRLVDLGQPVVIEGLELGACTHRWDHAYLVSKVGADREFVVHEASTRQLSFATKNFSYRKQDFYSFLGAAIEGAHVYLRSVSSVAPNKQAASLASDFAELAADFSVPPQLSEAITPETTHSSVLRISGDVNMWLHYDVMANVLCQIVGSRVVVLFPPSDISQLQFAAGQTTSSWQVFRDYTEEVASLPRGTKPQITTLSRGDVLLLPPCWPHATKTSFESRSASESPLSIATNIFFRNLAGETYSAGRDIYGNRDVSAYENGRVDLARVITHINAIAEGEQRSFAAEATVLALKYKGDVQVDQARLKAAVKRINVALSSLPEDLAGFYAQRLVDELTSRVRIAP